MGRRRVDAYLRLLTCGATSDTTTPWCSGLKLSHCDNDDQESTTSGLKLKSEPEVKVEAGPPRDDDAAADCDGDETDVLEEGREKSIVEVNECSASCCSSITERADDDDDDDDEVQPSTTPDIVVPPATTLGTTVAERISLCALCKIIV